MSDCLFCQIVAGHIPASKVYEDDNIVAFNDINPQAPVHILIIPKKHLATLDDISESDTQLMGQLYQVAKKIAHSKGIEVDQIEKGYRLVMNCGKGGGQEVWHMHLHLLAGRTFNWPAG